jgi:cobalamin-dependent methionine synthase I
MQLPFVGQRHADPLGVQQTQQRRLILELRPQAAYGYWKAAGQGNELIVFEPDGSTELCRFNLPRQPKE